MRNVPGILKGVAIFVLIAAIGIAIGLWNSKRPARPEVKETPAQQATGTEPIATPPPEPRPAPALVAPVPQPVAPVPAVVQVETPAPSNVLTNWEEKLEEILDSDAEEKQKAIQMAAALPNMPQEGQMEVAQHLSNLVMDEDYGLIAGFLSNANLPEDVLDVFLADSLNRPNAVKLPMLLDVARNPQHPKATEAKEILELFLEEDYGTDWNKWDANLKEWIKNNPD